MVRFIMVIGGLAFLAFMLWCFLPMFTAMNTIINSTVVNATALGIAQWDLMPFIIAGIIIVALVWVYFRRKGIDED